MNALPPQPPAVRTTCPYCGVGCGIVAAVEHHGGATISGDPAHPANFGRLCSKGSALGETLSLDGRLLHPMLRLADGSLARTDWNAALAKVADGLRTIVDRDGPDAIAFYLSGQLLTEDYYVANKLMKGFLGSANVDNNSRLCMASSVAGHRRAFGADVVPGTYRDLDEADLIVLVGSNAAWCHPVLYQRMTAARTERGAKLVVIDPRRTATAEAADLFLPIACGMDTALFCGLLVHLADAGALNDGYIAQYTTGFADALKRARDIAGDAAATARTTALDVADVARFFALFQQNERVVTCYSQGVNQSAQGTDKVNAIINVHLATGRIGRPGMGPFSLTGQPNAMGGREVGGLANQLAAHMSWLTPPNRWSRSIPMNAAGRGVTDGGFARVTTAHGSAVFRVCIQSSQQRGSIFAPIHWSDATSADSRVGAMAMAENDPFSGQPELKATPARIEPLTFAYRGFALTRDLIALPEGTWFARVAVGRGHGLLFATNELPERWHACAGKLIPDGAERAEYVDLPRGIVRVAALRAGRIEACIFSGPSENPPRWDVVRALFNSENLAERDRRLLLSGRSAEGMVETGPIVCACYGVGLETIRRALAEGSAATVAEIGRTLRAGTNCGSCVPELQGIIERASAPRRLQA